MLDILYGTGQGWAHGKDYLFTVQYNADRVRIDVAGSAFNAGRTIFDLTGNFSSGGIDFYNYSQPQVTFSKVTLDPRDSNPVSEPSSIALLGIALCGVLVSRRGSTTSRHGAGQMPAFG